MQIEPATVARFDEIHDVLAESFGDDGLGKNEWRRIVDYDFAGGREDRGWVLVDRGAIVGFLGAIYSRRGADRVCNVTGWAVKKTHRSAALKLLVPLFELRDHTILNLSATPFTISVFRRMGFRELERRVVIVPPLLPARAPRGYSVVREPHAIERLLAPDDRRIFEDHARYACSHLVLAGANDYLYVVAARTGFRRFPASYYYYLSDPDLFRRLAAPVQRTLSLAHRTPFGVVDARLLGDRAPRGCVTYTLRQPRLYRPAIDATRTREQIDALYTELVLLDPRRWTFNY